MSGVCHGMLCCGITYHCSLCYVIVSILKVSSQLIQMNSGKPDDSFLKLLSKHSNRSALLGNNCVYTVVFLFLWFWSPSEWHLQMLYTSVFFLPQIVCIFSLWLDNVPVMADSGDYLNRLILYLFQCRNKVSRLRDPVSTLARCPRLLVDRHSPASWLGDSNHNSPQGG